MITGISIIEGRWGNGEYKYNVQVLYDGEYCGQGRFCRTYEDAKKYIINELKGE